SDRRAHRLAYWPRCLLLPAETAARRPCVRAAGGRDASTLPDHSRAVVREGPLPYAGRLRTDARRTAAPNNVPWHVRSRADVLPQQHRCLRRPDSQQHPIAILSTSTRCWTENSLGRSIARSVCQIHHVCATRRRRVRLGTGAARPGIAASSQPTSRTAE